MEFALLQLLFGMNAFGMTTGNPISFYRFDVNPVERCPMNATEFETAARKRNCTGNNRYLCAPDRNLSNLIEFCTDTKRSLFEKGNCLRLEGTGDLNHYRCVERFVSGCPTGPYTDEEIYKYTSCLELNLDLNCFVADKNCQKRLLTTTEFFFNDSKDEATTDKYFNDSTDGDVLKNAEPETYDGSHKLQIAIFVVYGFLLVAILTGSVAFHFYKKVLIIPSKMPKTRKTDLSATRSQRGGRRRQRPERAGRASSSTAAEQVAQPPVQNQMVASHSPQPSTAPMMVAPSVTGAGPTDAIGSTQQESTEMAQGEERDKDQTTIKIPADVINNRDINQSIETDIVETDVSMEIGEEKEIVGDGNCFYRSISVYLYGHQNNHHEIRREIIQYMSEREHEYCQLMYDRSRNYEGYLEHHRYDGEWAEHPMIHAAADLYGMNIYVTSARYSKNHLYKATSEHSSVDRSRWLHLRHENNHYNIIGRDGFTNNLHDQDVHDRVDLRMLLSRSSRPNQTWRESTEEEKKAIVTVMPSDSELIGHRGNNMKQRPTTGKETLEPEKEKREIKDKANSVSTRLASTHPFSKGTNNQKCVLSSYIKAEVSRSVGLIYIDNKPTWTGFRVGEMYIVTCAHVIEEVVSAGPHFIACDRMAIEFDRKKFNQRVDTSQVFHFRDISYFDFEHDFVVLELSCHQDGVGFPPPLTCFGEVALSEIHLVGHPDGREMKEDDIFPYWSTEHENKIKELGNWSKVFFPDKKDYYSVLLDSPRKILFDTTFNHGASGSPGVMIRDDKPCVVLMFAGVTPKYIFDNPYSTLQVEDHQKVEYGFPISDIYTKMWNSPRQNVKDLASNIFTKFL